jgi:endonuclease YncB( thermonuclease family)
VSRDQIILLACLLVPWSIATSANAADFTGPVISVLDGDTIEVPHRQRPERIRLSGIDCPEKGQAFGNNAKQAASALVFGRDVILQTHGQDKYNRTLGEVFPLLRRFIGSGEQDADTRHSTNRLTSEAVTQSGSARSSLDQDPDEPHWRTLAGSR